MCSKDAAFYSSGVLNLLTQDMYTCINLFLIYGKLKSSLNPVARLDQESLQHIGSTLVLHSCCILFCYFKMESEDESLQTKIRRGEEEKEEVTFLTWQVV